MRHAPENTGWGAKLLKYSNSNRQTVSNPSTRLAWSWSALLPLPFAAGLRGMHTNRRLVERSVGEENRAAGRARLPTSGGSSEAREEILAAGGAVAAALHTSRCRSPRNTNCGITNRYINAVLGVLSDTPVGESLRAVAEPVSAVDWRAAVMP